MDKQTKQKYLEMLRSNEFFKMALQTTDSEEERKKIAAYAEDVFLNTIQGFSIMKDTIEKHPDKVAEVAKNRIPNDSNVIKDK